MGGNWGYRTWFHTWKIWYRFFVAYEIFCLNYLKRCLNSFLGEKRRGGTKNQLHSHFVIEAAKSQVKCQNHHHHWTETVTTSQLSWHCFNQIPIQRCFCSRDAEFGSQHICWYQSHWYLGMHSPCSSTPVQMWVKVYLFFNHSRFVTCLVQWKNIEILSFSTILPTTKNSVCRVC